MPNIQSKIRIKFVNNDIQTDNKNKSNTYKVAFKNRNQFETEKQNILKEIEFNVNDKVIHNEQKLTGTINFIGTDKISIVWDDGTRERFLKSELNQISINNTSDSENNSSSKTEAIDNGEIETRKITSSKPVEPVSKLSELDELYNQAFTEMDDEYDDIMDANPNKLKEQMLKRQVDMMEKKLENKKISNIKEQSVNELISLMKDKGMLSKELEVSKKEEILKMTDSEFDSFKQSIISNTSGNSEPELSEAEKMLQRIKFGGPIIGGFDESPSSSVGRGFAETRSLSGGQTRSLESVASKNEQHPSGLNFDGFKDLQGLTKPLQVVSEQKSPRQNIADAISSIDWTTMTKMF